MLKYISTTCQCLNTFTLATPPPPPPQLEQEVEHIREAQRLLEANTVRREKLERAMRSRLEQELLKLREDSLQRKGIYDVAEGWGGGGDYRCSLYAYNY